MSAPAIPLNVLVQAREALRVAAARLMADDDMTPAQNAAEAAGALGYYLEPLLKTAPEAEVAA